jgi:DNA-directed RNA polymerase II subunit RPB9
MLLDQIADICSPSSNMLYPKENHEDNTLEFACRTCSYSQEADTSCVFRNQLSNTVGATAGITQDVGQDPTVGLPSLPDFCTLCGQEIFCEICGQETDRGFWLEVDDNDAAATGLMTPTSMSASSTPQELATSQQLEQLHLGQHDQHDQGPDSQKKEEDQFRHNHNTVS